MRLVFLSNLSSPLSIIHFHISLVSIEKRVYPIPFRTRQSSSSSPMILHILVWESRPMPRFSFERSSYDGLSSFKSPGPGQLPLPRSRGFWRLGAMSDEESSRRRAAFPLWTSCRSRLVSTSDTICTPAKSFAARAFAVGKTVKRQN